MRETLLIEIGLEELPPLSVSPLSHSFGETVARRLTSAGFSVGTTEIFGTPRRIAVSINDVSSTQPDYVTTKKGPAIKTAFDESGNPTKAAEGFARSCGVDVNALTRLRRGHNEWLTYKTTVRGKPILQAIVSITEETLSNIPLPKKMKWGDGEEEFIRPIRWVSILYGTEAAIGSVLGIEIDRYTYGHRFMNPGKLILSSALDYSQKLRSSHVIPDLEERRKIIQAQISNLASSVETVPIIDGSLLDEVCALVEWPRAILGTFDEEFLALPEEVVISSMQDHQKYFPLRDKDNKLKNAFVAVANIQSDNETLIKEGNERVIRPRLEDAKFFFDQDQKVPLLSRYKKLSGIVFEKRLGNLLEKSERIMRIVSTTCSNFNAQEKLCVQASKASRCDLTTDMVGEFPNLQGVMGAAYLSSDLNSIAEAVKYFHHPRFANDILPPTPEGQCVAFADRLDTLVGITGIGLKPTGDKDPFGLRRAAIGLVRILVENKVDISLPLAIKAAIRSYKNTVLSDETESIALQFILDRMRGYFVEKGADTLIIKAAMSSESRSPEDIALRINALQSFYSSAESGDLIAANRRISNILKKNPLPQKTKEIRQELLLENSEISLANHYKETVKKAEELYKKRQYENYLIEIGSFKNVVDDFFDNVQVITDEKKITINRLSLLEHLNELFRRIGDLSLLNQSER